VLSGHARALFSHHVYAARFRKDPTGAVKLYCFYALLQPDFRARAAGFASGTTVLALPRDAVLDLAVVMPGPEAIEQFQRACAPWLALKQANSAEAITLAELRDALLPKLLSGELRVRDADRIVERAV
jgi:type I restriction enzyme S subunit